ncbi:transposable element Tc1 transposase [Trichonephila clavipes]|nr:transposable element Tc1 transposase [Trichonephila clavipes]
MRSAIGIKDPGYLCEVFLDCIGPDCISFFIDGSAQPHRTHIVDKFYEGIDIPRMDCPSRSPDHNSIEYVWDGLGKAISQGSSPPRTSQELKISLLEIWSLLPQILIDTLINSMAARYEACVAIHSGHIPY